MTHLIKTMFGLLLLSATIACNSQPKVIEAEADSGKPIFQDPGVATNHEGHNHPVASGGNDGAEHKVTVAEVLNTDKYSYLRVNENGQEAWIAISKRDISVGGNYIYKGGLMKKNFFSKEFNRTFETVLLVGDFREANAQASGSAALPQPAATVEPPKSVKAAPGAIKIADLVSNLKKYEGKTVAVTGKVVKVNPMIMGRNWIHLQDGSGKNIDLTITTTEMVNLGDIVTLEGTFNLNRDFGAGYRYDYIVEGGKLKM